MDVEGCTGLFFIGIVLGVSGFAVVDMTKQKFLGLLLVTLGVIHILPLLVFIWIKAIGG